VNTFLTFKSCRNTYCTGAISCICDEGGGSSLTLAPSETPSPLGGGRQIVLTVSSFTNDSGQTGPTPTLTGLTEPGAKVTISIFPDGVFGEVTADSSGRWSWRSPKALTAGKKDLLVIAKKDDGQGQVSQSFTAVAGGGGISNSLLIVLLVLGLGVGGYLYFKSKQS